jgi:hypothetical protein
MERQAIQHLSVWLDALAPPGGAFAQALDWATHLHLPMHGLAVSNMAPSALVGSDGVIDQGPCIAACAARGVPFEPMNFSDSVTAARQLFHPRTMSVFSDAVPPDQRMNLLRWSLKDRCNAVLVCTRAYHPVSRVLILHQPGHAEPGYLASALTLCKAFQVLPIILTAARTESKAREGQRAAETVCYAERMAAHLDYVVGLELRAAVASIARWRRCSHVIMPRRQAISWWRWLGGDTLKELLELADSLTFLALPECGIGLPPAATLNGQQNSRLVTL